jgi:PHD/YefM family antitoxin component YafN of YafNO toxin-antitoxin module
VEHVGISKLRALNAKNLRQFDRTMVIRDNNKPLAVLVSYEQFLDMQKQLVSLLQTVELLKSDQEIQDLNNGLQDVSQGRTKPLSDIKEELNKKQVRR